MFHLWYMNVTCKLESWHNKITLFKSLSNKSLTFWENFEVLISTWKIVKNSNLIKVSYGWERNSSFKKKLGCLCCKLSQVLKEDRIKII